MSFSSEAAFRGSMTAAEKANSPLPTPKSPGAPIGVKVDNPAQSTQDALDVINQSAELGDQSAVPKQKVSAMGYKLIPNQSQVRARSFRSLCSLPAN